MGLPKIITDIDSLENNVEVVENAVDNAVLNEMLVPGIDIETQIPIIVGDTYQSDKITLQDPGRYFISDRVSGALQEVGSQLASKATKTELLIQKGRIDVFESLPEGATTNDARLEDICVGADGKVWDNPANAVRGQVGTIREDLTDLTAGLVPFMPTIHNEGYVNNVHKIITASSAYGYSDIILLEKGDVLKAKGQSNTANVVDMLSSWNSNGTKYYSSIYAYKTTSDEEYIYTATDREYVRFCNTSTSTCELQKTSHVITEATRQKDVLSNVINGGYLPLELNYQTDVYINNVQKGLVSGSGYKTSEIFTLNKGEKVKVTGLTKTAKVVDMIAKFDDEDSTYPHSIYFYDLADKFETFEYIATENVEYLRVCYSYLYGDISVSKSMFSLDEYTKVLKQFVNPSYTTTTGKWISSITETFMTNPTGVYTSVFKLSKNDEITIKGGASNLGSALALLSSWSEDGTKFKSAIVNSATDFEETTFVAEEDIFVRLSWMTDSVTTVSVCRYITTGNIANVFSSIAEDINEKPYPSISMFESIACCGDSYVKGQLYNSGGLIGDKPNIAWGNCIGRLNGVDAHIYASSGADTNTWQSRSDCMPLALSEPAKGLYIFCLGINDSSYVTLGTINDIHVDCTTNPNTYYGNYGKIIEQIMSHAPKSKIILMSPFYRATSVYYKDHIQALKDITAHYGIALIDTADSKLAQSEFFMSGLVGGHPTSVLHGAMAKEIAKLVSKCIEDNYDYFKTYSGLN